MAWPTDIAKLSRVRALMKEQDLDALVVRAPDNVVYLSNYWCMKGYDALVFPREGESTLIALEPQLADAQRNSWTKDIRLFKGYDEKDPRPPQYRSLESAIDVLKERSLTRKIGIELNMGTQSADRMVGEPTTPTQVFFDSFRIVAGEVIDATPLLNEARAIKTLQEIEPTLLEIWVCVDGYWTDLTKNVCPGDLTAEYHRLLDLLLKVFNEAVSYAKDGASFPELDRLTRSRIAAGGYPGQPSHPICHGVGARAHEPPYAHQAGTGTIRKGMVLAIEPGIYWPGGGGLRLEDNFWITDAGNQKLCSYPDDFRLARAAGQAR